MPCEQKPAARAQADDASRHAENASNHKNRRKRPLRCRIPRRRATWTAGSGAWSSYPYRGGCGSQREVDRYSAYGVPLGLPEGDSNSDGVSNGTDRTVIQGWINGSSSPRIKARLGSSATIKSSRGGSRRGRGDRSTALRRILMRRSPFRGEVSVRSTRLLLRGVGVLDPFRPGVLELSQGHAEDALQ